MKEMPDVKKFKLMKVKSQARVVNHMKKVFSYILSLSQKGTPVLATDSGK